MKEGTEELADKEKGGIAFPSGVREPPKSPLDFSGNPEEGGPLAVDEVSFYHLKNEGLYERKMIPYNKHLTNNAKMLRKNMTPEEKHLWYDFLKRLPFTVKRQHNIEDYIVDFYIPEKKTVIEIDGEQHFLPENKLLDEKRDDELSKWGIRVLRYSNEDIRKNFDAVEENIMKILGIEYSELKAMSG